jgi:hypothetical protein
MGWRFCGRGYQAEILAGPSVTQAAWASRTAFGERLASTTVEDVS